MNRLTRLVLKRPVSTLLAVLALFVFGFSSLMGLRLELMPDMEMPMKIVYTVYPGADSESVDDLVTSIIEDKAGSLSGVKSITSRSMENVSMVLLQYDYDQNVNDAYLDLRAALDQVKGDLPDDAQDPMIIRDEHGFYAEYFLFCQHDGRNRCTCICKAGCGSGTGSTEYGGSGNRIWRSGTAYKGRT